MTNNTMMSIPVTAAMGNKMKQQQGFTIIELMAVVSIISILTVIILAVYGDYVVRTKVSEGMAFVGEARTSVSEYYYDQRRMPANNSQAGLADPDDYDQQDFIRRLEVIDVPRPGTIEITFKIIGSTADNKKLVLIPNTSEQVVNWTCEAPEDDGLDANQAPPSCRG